MPGVTAAWAGLLWFASGGRAITVLRREPSADIMQLDVWPSRPEDL